MAHKHSSTGMSAYTNLCNNVVILKRRPSNSRSNMCHSSVHNVKQLVWDRFYTSMYSTMACTSL